MQFEPTDIFPNIDPRLQRLLEHKSQGMTTAPTASTVEGEVAVIAKVRNFEAWLSLNEVYQGAHLGSTSTGEHIVTARIPLSRLENIKQSPSVVSIKAAQLLKPSPNTTVDEIPALGNLLPENTDGAQGRGVVIGIIDSGCDFAHKNLRHLDGSTRLLAFWNQDGTPSYDSPYGYGTEYLQDEINQALQVSNPYRALDYQLPYNAHGTHVMDIAAGNGQGSGIPGIAPHADIVFVQLSTSKLAPILLDAETALNDSFGDTVELLEAMKYIFDVAGDRPCVINVSLALNGGPHDGTTLVEQGIDALVTEKPNRAVVIAAGNSYDAGIHASGIVPQDGYFDLRWKVPKNNPRQKEVEVWYSGSDEFQLELFAPDGQSLGQLGLGENGRVVDTTDDRVMLFFAHRKCDPNNGDNVIGVFMEPDVPGGIWTLRLYGIQVTNGKFHAWIEREDKSQTSFVPPLDNSCTLNTIACGYQSIVVGSYNATKPNKPLSYFSSSGLTRDERQKPDFIAPGQHIWAAASCTGTETTRKSGTSMAAPVVTGVIALLLSEACARNLTLNIDQIRDILAANANNDFLNPDEKQRYGYGAIDASAAISSVQSIG